MGLNEGLGRRGTRTPLPSELGNASAGFVPWETKLVPHRAHESLVRGRACRADSQCLTLPDSLKPKMSEVGAVIGNTGGNEGNGGSECNETARWLRKIQGTRHETFEAGARGVGEGIPYGIEDAAPCKWAGTGAATLVCMDGAVAVRDCCVATGRKATSVPSRAQVATEATMRALVLHPIGEE